MAFPEISRIFTSESSSAESLPNIESSPKESNFSSATSSGIHVNDFSLNENPNPLRRNDRSVSFDTLAKPDRSNQKSKSSSSISLNALKGLKSFLNEKEKLSTESKYPNLIALKNLAHKRPGDVQDAPAFNGGNFFHALARAEAHGSTLNFGAPCLEDLCESSPKSLLASDKKDRTPFQLAVEKGNGRSAAYLLGMMKTMEVRRFETDEKIAAMKSKVKKLIKSLDNDESITRSERKNLEGWKFVDKNIKYASFSVHEFDDLPEDAVIYVSEFKRLHQEA